MVFSTYKFLFLFFPITLFLYRILCSQKQYMLAKLELIVASLIFYFIGSQSFFPFFLGSVFGNYIIGYILSKLPNGCKGKLDSKKLLLFIGIMCNVILLGYYKYTDFFISNYNWITGQEIPLKNIILPIGISFFTFQLIAYLVDSYRGITKSYDIINYLLFITFFPQLIVGPIVHHSDVMDQFEDPETYKINWENITKGIILFTIGCSKKLLLADPLTNSASFFFDSVQGNDVYYGALITWYHSIEYTISYYFDLSGYADMAIGLALFFNIAIPRNFNSPYKARNFQDYWKRWHMTLSRFLGDYIFRSVFRKGSKWRNYYVATMVTFFVSGFWHGAGWTFVVWGLINGFFVCCASYMSRKGWKFPALVAYPLTAVGVVLTRVLFVSNTFTGAWIVLKNMFCFGYHTRLHLGDFVSMLQYLITNYSVSIALLIGLIICWFMPNSQQIVEKVKPTKVMAIITAILMILNIINMSQVSNFLYFQF